MKIANFSNVEVIVHALRPAEVALKCFRNKSAIELHYYLDIYYTYV